MKKYAFFLLCFLITTIQVIAHEQTENLCTQKLKEAQKSYDNGLIERVPEMLKSCLDNGFSRNEKLQAYRLQILAYLFLDDNAAAEESLLKLLKIDPEYKVNTAVDPIELITLYDSYRTLPLYSIGFMGGVNKTIVSAYEPYGVNNVNEESEDYKSLMGYQLGVFADILLKGKFQINTGLSYNVKNYKSSNLLLGYTKLDIKEAQSWLDFPLLLKFTTGKHKLKFFLEAGLQASLLLRSNTTFLRTDAATGSNQAVGPSVDTKSLCHKMNYSVVVGMGARYKAGYGYFVLDARYAYGLRNIANPEMRYSNEELLYKYGYIGDNFTLNSIMISVGYFKSFYKPKKLKKANVE